MVCLKNFKNEIIVDGTNANLAPVVQKVDNAMHRINLSPLDSTISFLNTYPLASDLSDR